MTALIELSEHLLDLLFRQKMATIPELGTFEFNVLPAELHPAENKLSPPQYELIFKEYSTIRPEMSFVDFLIKEKNYDPYDAEVKVKAFVHMLRNGINTQEKCYLPNFGSFTKTSTGIKFHVTERLKLLKPSMGLPELTLIPLNLEYSPEMIEAVTQPHTFVDTTSEYVSSEKNRWVLPLIVFFLLLGGGLIAYYFYNETKQISSNDSLDTSTSVTSTSQDSLILSESGFEDTTSANGVSSTASPANSAVDVPPTTPPMDTISTTMQTPMNPDVLLTTTEADCAVIVGVMAQKTNVKKLAAVIRKAGYTPFSYVSKGLTRIGAATACDEKSINKTLADMQKINVDAWVYKQH